MNRSECLEKIMDKFTSMSDEVLEQIADGKLSITLGEADISEVSGGFKSDAFKTKDAPPPPPKWRPKEHG